MNSISDDAKIVWNETSSFEQMLVQILSELI